MFLRAWNMSSGMVEIHKAGCSHNPDSGKSKYRAQDQVEFGKTDWATKYDFAHDYWDNGILEENEAENGVGSFDVFQEMDFKPCTKSLPLNQTERENEMPAAKTTAQKIVAGETTFTEAVAGILNGKPAATVIQNGDVVPPKSPAKRTPRRAAPVTTTKKSPAAKSPAVTAAEKKAAARKVVPAAKPAAKAPATKKVDGPEYADYAAKPITDSMKAYFAWIKKTTGVTVDERSAYLGYTLRSQYQAANRAAK